MSSNTSLIVLIIVVIILVLLGWFISNQMKTEADNSELILNDNSDKVIEKWLKDNSKLTFNITITPEEIAAKYIKNIYNYKVNPDNIIIGNNLNDKYYQLTNSNLETKFSNNNDCILYLRSSIGIDYEIVIINSSEKIKVDLRNGLHKANIFFLNNAIESDTSKSAHNYLRKLLNLRWETLLELNNPNILERQVNDSYVYLRNNNSKYNLLGFTTDLGIRLNLLCTDQEFNQLISRLKLPNT